jgi:hypothetical protein
MLISGYLAPHHDMKHAVSSMHVITLPAGTGVAACFAGEPELLLGLLLLARQRCGTEG